MKTISVKQVAAALDITPRAVIYRLEKNQLKGSQTPNAFGKQEWRVYPTKEIVEGLKRKTAHEGARKEEPVSEDFNFSAEDLEIAEAQIISDGSAEGSTERNSEPQNDFSASEAGRDWQSLARDTVQSIAEELVRPLGEIIKRQEERLAEQEEMLAERDLLLEDKERQLKLLPDLEKQAEDRRQEAEARRKEAEAKELEAIALNKQIEAMKAAADTKALEVERLSRLESDILPTLEQQLEQERLQKQQALQKIAALEEARKEVEETKRKLEQSLQSEISRLREEKAEQAQAIETKFDALNQKLEELQKPQLPWWKKMFSA